MTSRAIRSLVLVLAWAISTSAFCAEIMSKDAFTTYFVDQARASLKDVSINAVRPLEVHSKNAAEHEATTFLDNAYAQYTANPSSLTAIMNSHIGGLALLTEQSFNLDARSIFAVLKSADYLDGIRRQLARGGLGNKPMPLVYTKLNDDIYVVYVFDNPAGMKMVTHKDLEAQNIEEGALRNLAEQNLATYFEHTPVKIDRLNNTGEAKIYRVSVDQNYEASTLLLDKYWNKSMFDVRGDIVAFIPARNVVLVTGADDRAGIALASGVAKKGYAELGYAISPRGYRFDSGKWTPLPSDPGQ